MGLFDSIIGGVTQQTGIGSSAASSLLSALISYIAGPKYGGLVGFLDMFRHNGMGDLVDSWVSTGANKPLTDNQIEASLGDGVVNELSQKAGIAGSLGKTALAFIIPMLVDKLTPNGSIPDNKSFLSTVGEYITGAPRAATATAARVVDRAEDTSGSFLKWLIPLLLLGLLLALGYMFCGRGTPVANVNTNVNVNRPVVNANANVAKALDSSFKITAANGKYTVSGVVPDQKTVDQIKAKLDAQFGAGNVDYTGMKVDATAKPFAADWWANFEKMLPNLKGWKDGALAFAGNAITEAAGLPGAALDQLKSLFSGWTLPSSLGAAVANAARALTDVTLPNGTKLQAYPGGIEDQLVKFIQSDDYKNGTNDTLKEKWFNFDDLNFVFGKTELTPESKRQLDNITAILKAFPDAKIKIGGYTDRKGEDAANKKLSDDRAKAVQAALQKAGVGAQVPEAEGYGEQFATVEESASDEARQVDRRTSIRLIK